MKEKGGETLYGLTRENKEMGFETNRQLGFRKENKCFLPNSRNKQEFVR